MPYGCLAKQTLMDDRRRGFVTKGETKLSTKYVCMCGCKYVWLECERHINIIRNERMITYAWNAGHEA